jgi:hypothetical protein
MVPPAAYSVHPSGPRDCRPAPSSALRACRPRRDRSGILRWRNARAHAPVKDRPGRRRGHHRNRLGLGRLPGEGRAGVARSLQRHPPARCSGRSPKAVGSAAAAWPITPWSGWSRRAPVASCLIRNSLPAIRSAPASSPRRRTRRLDLQDDGREPPQEHGHAPRLRARCRTLPRSRGRGAVVSILPRSRASKRGGLGR